MNTLDNQSFIKKLDSQDMLGSLEFLGEQVEQAWIGAKQLRLPQRYRLTENIVVLGMGGSTLGAHIIKTLYQDQLKAPLEIINNYHLPAYVDNRTLVIASSYSGNTEEPLAAFQEAVARGANMVVVTSGGSLAAMAVKGSIPAVIYSTTHNPCGSPRMAIGYSLSSIASILSKVGLLRFTDKDVDQAVASIKRYHSLFGARRNAKSNIAKQIALQLAGKSPWFVGSEHLLGNAHVAANQTNETAKRFAGYFEIPELNHHLMEGMLHPATNKEALLFILFESALYDKRNNKRYKVTKKVLDKNGIRHLSYKCSARDRLEQACELLVLSGYVSYYCALLNKIDPTAIPFVDYFKEQMKK